MKKIIIVGLSLCFSLNLLAYNIGNKKAEDNMNLKNKTQSFEFVNRNDFNNLKTEVQQLKQIIQNQNINIKNAPKEIENLECFEVVVDIKGLHAGRPSAMKKRLCLPEKYIDKNFWKNGIYFGL